MDKIQIPDLEPQNELGEDELAGDAEVREAFTSQVTLFLRNCWAKRRMIVTIVAIGTLASVIYALCLPKEYTSTTVLMPPDSSSPSSDIISMLSPGTGGSIAAELESQSLGISTPGDLFVAVLESRNVEDGLIRRFNLSQYYGTRLIEDTRRSLEGDTKIGLDEKSGVIGISVTARSPEFASNLARGYVEELNRVVTDNSTSVAHRERVFLEGRVNATKKDLDEAAKQLSQFSSKSGAVDVASQTKSMVDEGLKLQAALIDGRSELAALRQSYSEDNVRVRAQEAHNAELQRQLEKMGGVPNAGDVSTGDGKSPYPTVLQLPTLGLTYYDLERRLEVEESLWEALTKEYEAAKVQEAAEIPSVQVLDSANVPESKSGPRRRLIVMFGAMLSLFLSLMLVYIQMAWEGVSSENELKQLITTAAGASMQPQRWYWRLPGLSRLRRRLKGSESLPNAAHTSSSR